MEAAIVIGIVLMVGLLVRIMQKKKASEPRIQVAPQITLERLGRVMNQLVEGNMEHDFFGITSDGSDCIYFMLEAGKINIDFEVMLKEQQPYVDKLLGYAEAKGIPTSKLSYGNRPNYPELAEAPVFRLTLNATSDQATKIGSDIMKSVFGKNGQEKFDVVP